MPNTELKFCQIKNQNNVKSRSKTLTKPEVKTILIYKEVSSFETKIPTTHSG
jgi:hypothetical protein